jgi:hypothetical protein
MTDIASSPLESTSSVQKPSPHAMLYDVFKDNNCSRQYEGHEQE